MLGSIEDWKRVPNSQASIIEIIERAIEAKTHRRGWAAVGGIYLAAFVAIWAILSSNVDSRRATVQTNRAWLSMVEPGLKRSLDDPKGPLFVANYQNVGHVPAVDVATSLAPIGLPLKSDGGLRSNPEIVGGWQRIGDTLKKACEARSPVGGLQIVFPNGTGSEEAPLSGVGTDVGAIEGGHQLLMLGGCLTYRTFGQVHHTVFCHYLSRARDNAKWEFLDCPTGNFAD